MNRNYNNDENEYGRYGKYSRYVRNMPEDSYNTRGRNRNRTGITRAEGIWAVMIIAFCFILCICAAFLNDINRIFNSSKYAVSIDKKTYYAVSAGEFDNIDKARQKSAEIIARRGAGYIFGDISYTVLMSIYGNETDAIIVAANNSGSIYNIVVPELKFNISASKTEISAVNNALTAFASLSGKLIELSKSFDKEEITSGILIQTLYDEADLLTAYANTLYGITAAEKNIQMIAEYLDLAVDCIGSVTDTSIVDRETSVLLRYSTIKIIHNYQKLFIALA